MNAFKSLNKAVYALALLPLACSAAEQDIVEFRLSSPDVQALAERDGVIWLQLSPDAASRLQATTEQAYGKRLQVDLEGMSVLETDVFATIDSGVIQIFEPSPQVRMHLERLKQLRESGS